MHTGVPADARGGAICIAVGEGSGVATIGSIGTVSRRALPSDIITTAGRGELGGTASIHSGNGCGGAAGAIDIAGALGEDGDGATAFVSAGATRGEFAGVVILEAGDSLSNVIDPNVIGGAALALGGGATARSGGGLHLGGGGGDASGAVRLCSQVATASGASGSLNFGSGTSSDGNSGAVCLRSGNGNGATGGGLTTSVGTAHGCAGGDALIAAGDSSARTGASGGHIALCCPSGGDGDRGGTLTLVAGPGYPGGDVPPSFRVHANLYD